MANLQNRGYNKQLLVLPFDHRGSFQEKLFGIKGKPTAEETKMIASFKTIIYEGFEKAVRSGLPKEIMGILVDEQFGTEVIQRAKASGFSVSVPAEKSGQDEFDFEYSDYPAQIEKTNPDLVKVLVRYNPEGNKEMNCRQAGRLAELSKYLEKTDRKFMFELLVPATEEQLKKCNGDKKVFDREIRPTLMVQAIKDLQKSGIEPDVWKLEGLDKTEDFLKVCQAAREGGREKVGCIVLGRGESSEKVREWLQAGVNVKGVIGFAVGRTVFWEPLKAFKEGKISREEASQQIAENYSGFCRMWLEARQ
jgi:5-dehydro-2-deoxygluconokinase